MEIIKKHVDTVVIVGAILGSMLWMNGKFNTLEKDMAVVKAVLVMKNIMPAELVAQKKE